MSINCLVFETNENRLTPFCSNNLSVYFEVNQFIIFYHMDVMNLPIFNSFCEFPLLKFK